MAKEVCAASGDWTTILGSSQGWAVIGMYLAELIYTNVGTTFNVLMRMSTLLEHMRRTHLYERHLMGYDFMMGGMICSENAVCNDGAAGSVSNTDVWRYSDGNKRNTHFFYLSGLNKLTLGPGSLGTRASMLELRNEKDRDAFKTGINRDCPILIPRPLSYMGPAYFYAQQAIFNDANGFCNGDNTYKNSLRVLMDLTLEYYSNSQPTRCCRISEARHKGWVVSRDAPLRRRAYFDDLLYDPEIANGKQSQAFITSTHNFTQKGDSINTVRPTVYVSNSNVSAILGLQVAKVTSKELVIEADETDYVTNPDFFLLKNDEEDLITPVLGAEIKLRAGFNTFDMDISPFGYPLFSSDGSIATFGAEMLRFSADYSIERANFNITEICTLLSIELTRLESRVLNDIKGSCRLTVNQAAFMHCVLATLQNREDLATSPGTKLNYGSSMGLSGINRLEALGYSKIRVALVGKLANTFKTMNATYKEFSQTRPNTPVVALANFQINLNVCLVHTAACLGLIDIISKIIFKVPFMNGVQCLAPVPLALLLKQSYTNFKKMAEQSESVMTTKRNIASQGVRSNTIVDGEYIVAFHGLGVR